MPNEFLFLEDEWLSKCLHVPCYVLNSRGVAFDFLPKSGPLFISAKVLDNELYLTAGLLKIGFRDINRQVQYRKELQKLESNSKTQFKLPLGFKISIRDSLDQSVKFSFLFEYDRFTMDKILPPSWSANIKGQWLRGIDPKKRFLIVYEKENVVGFILYREGPSYVIELLCVLKEFRGMGLARSMLSYLEGVAREKQVSEVRVGTQKENPNSTYLYEKYGFSLADEKRVLHFSRGIKIND